MKFTCCRFEVFRGWLGTFSSAKFMPWTSHHSGYLLKDYNSVNSLPNCINARFYSLNVSFLGCYGVLFVFLDYSLCFCGLRERFFPCWPAQTVWRQLRFAKPWSALCFSQLSCLPSGVSCPGTSTASDEFLLTLLSYFLPLEGGCFVPGGGPLTSWVISLGVPGPTWGFGVLSWSTQWRLVGNIWQVNSISLRAWGFSEY